MIAVEMILYKIHAFFELPVDIVEARFEVVQVVRLVRVIRLSVDVSCVVCEMELRPPAHEL